MTMSSFIVVFGAAVRADGAPSGTLERRVRSAWLFGRRWNDVRYLVSGGIGATPYPEWQVMQRLLVEAGVPSERIIAEPNGVDTLSQVRNCVTILRELDAAGDVWIATSRYHQARCWLLFRLLGIKTSLVPALSDLPGVPLRKLLFFWVREILALPYDALVVLCMK